MGGHPIELGDSQPQQGFRCLGHSVQDARLLISKSPATVPNVDASTYYDWWGGGLLVVLVQILSTS